MVRRRPGLSATAVVAHFIAQLIEIRGHQFRVGALLRCRRHHCESRHWGQPGAHTFQQGDCLTFERHTGAAHDERRQALQHGPQPSIIEFGGEGNQVFHGRGRGASL